MSLRQQGRDDAAVLGGERAEQGASPQLLNLLTVVYAEGQVEERDRADSEHRFQMPLARGGLANMIGHQLYMPGNNYHLKDEGSRYSQYLEQSI